MKNIFLAKAKDGKLDFGSETNQARLRMVVKENEGRTFRLEMMKTTRTLSQNAFYWLYLSVIERETGNNANDLHELFKRILLPPRYLTVLGKEIKIPASTASLSKSEFSEYMDKICAETNVPIPNPVDAGFYSEHN